MASVLVALYGTPVYHIANHKAGQEASEIRKLVESSQFERLSATEGRGSPLPLLPLASRLPGSSHTTRFPADREPGPPHRRHEPGRGGKRQGLRSKLPSNRPPGASPGEAGTITERERKISRSRRPFRAQGRYHQPDLPGTFRYSAERPLKEPREQLQDGTSFHLG
jgi:hypothetical protein